MSKFDVGTIVKTVNGLTPKVVVGFDGKRIKTQNLYGHYGCRYREKFLILNTIPLNEDHLIRLEEILDGLGINPNNEESETRTEGNDMTPRANQLFQTADNKYGNYVATNSQGQFILEMKGSNGDVAAFAPADLTKVVPYSVRIQKFGSDTTLDRAISPDAGLKKGDVLMLSNSSFMWRVVKLDLGLEEVKGFKGDVSVVATKTVHTKTATD